MNKNETVTDICDIFRRAAKLGLVIMSDRIENIADRIEAAHRREMTKLNEALKPIIDCDVSYFDRRHWINAFDAIRLAQKVLDVKCESKCLVCGSVLDMYGHCSFCEAQEMCDTI